MHWTRLTIAMAKQHADQFSVYGIQIAANNLQGRLKFLRNPQQNLIHLADPAPHMNLQLPISISVALRISTFFSQALKSYACVVAIFFQHHSHSNQVIRLESAPRFFELCVSKFLQQLRSVHRVRFVVESRLKFGNLAPCRGRRAAKNGRAQPH